jgi:hypothetical protein
MSSGSSGKKGLSRRSLLSIAGGAAGLLTAKKFVGSGSATSSSTTQGAPAQAKLLRRGAQTSKVAELDVAQPTLDLNSIAYDLPAPTQQVRQLLSPLRPGARLYGWTVVSIHDVHMGAIPVILQDADGRRFQVDILRKHGEGPRAVADTEKFSVFLANSGNGLTPSNESHGLGAIALATVLTRGEKRGVPGGVMTLRERSRRFPNGSYAAPA